ncbi:bile acid:sodium symporter [Aestuariirhabdus sp. Z084]|uniref:bile acid:sodium symporter family protein n=1 Tax=Aestuariirhabdus haliotis TaxID=2918751 RepID=UPI00201B4029|nr:bile acid:sodium symporter [Aestuariirhabdus haliotis]MCL6414900.1 bile acid:sodium symporter [Aestuariirhabdus haliotis]MCL6418832.1 bile acid:sodium symporter [Aestuariirhabdus haliotis]
MSQIAMTIILPIALGWIMFCVGLALTPADFRRVLVTPGQVVTGLVLQLAGLPLLALSLIYLMDLQGIVAVGLWLLALSPGGATSNAISQMCGGDAALSITLTGMTSLIVPLSMPLLLPVVLAGVELQLPYKTAVLQLTVVTVVPVVIGMLLRHLGRRVVVRILPWMQRSAFTALVATVVVIVLANQHVVAALWSLAALAALLLCLMGMLLGYCVSRYWRDHPALGPTFAVEVGIQNAGTAIFVAAVMLQRPELAMTPLVYGVLMNIPALLLIARRHRRSVVVGGQA